LISATKEQTIVLRERRQSVITVEYLPKFDQVVHEDKFLIGPPLTAIGHVHIYTSFAVIWLTQSVIDGRSEPLYGQPDHGTGVLWSRNPNFYDAKYVN
jgi:hypothetical protein